MHECSFVGRGLRGHALEVLTDAVNSTHIDSFTHISSPPLIAQTAANALSLLHLNRGIMAEEGNPVPAFVEAARDGARAEDLARLKPNDVNGLAPIGVEFQGKRVKLRMPALVAAAWYGHYDSVRDLVMLGADPDKADQVRLQSAPLCLPIATLQSPPRVSPVCSRVPLRSTGRASWAALSCYA
jgi:hypothetical protein